MELKTFIKQSLIDIASAVKEANEDNSTDMIVNPNKLISAGEANQRISRDNNRRQGNDIRYVQNIKFDVAVSVSEGTERNINVAGGNVGETTGNNNEHSTASRIQFELPIALPHGEF